MRLLWCLIIHTELDLKIAGKKITFSVGMFLSDKHVYDDIQIPVDLCTVSQNPKTQTVEVFGGGGEDFEKVIDLHGRGQAQAMVPGDGAGR